MKSQLALASVLGIGVVVFCCYTPPVEESLPIPPPERVASALTVYNGGRALVKDTRRFDLDQGSNTVRFDDVTSGIVPGSVQVAGTDTRVSVHEQNYEYDLVSTPKLLQRYLGQRIQVTTAEGNVHDGTLLSGSGDVILEPVGGGVVVLRLDQIRDLEFPGLPEGLASRPSLLWDLAADQGGQQDLTVTYLTGGFGWSADYVVTLSDADDAVDLSGWVSVTNHSEATFEDSRLKLVAGDVNLLPLADATSGDEPDQSRYSRREAEAQSKAMPVERSFFDYHLYEMPRPVTLRSRETKQVEFIDAGAIPAEVTYELTYDGYWYGETVTRNPSVSVELVNGEEQGLGAPLPAGIVRVYKRDVDGASELAGESRIDHTPRDEKVHLTVGQAFDIVGEWRQVKRRDISMWVQDVSYEVVVRNHKTEDVSITLTQHPYAWGQWSVRNATAEHRKTDNNTLQFDVVVPADGETTVTYTIRNRW
jgi:hypothetical protein